MRKLIIARGAPGSGKSTLTDALGLANHRLSADQFRTALAGTMLNSDGEWRIDQSVSKRAWELTMEAFELRIGRGETIALEGKFTAVGEMTAFIERAHQRGYQIMIVDLWAVGVTELIINNDRRPTSQRTRPESYAAEREKALMVNMPAWIEEQHPGKSIEYTPVERRDDAIPAARRFLEQGTEPIELGHFKKVVHIGDLQGVAQALHGHAITADGTVIESPVPPRLDDAVAYIFVGDALDRGIENGKLMRWLIDEVTPRLGRNVWWIRGNHELHLERWINGEEPISREFAARTLPDLEAHCITPEMVKPFVEQMLEVMVYYWHSEKVIVTHGGLPKAVEDLHLVASDQLMKGTGHHSDMVDAAFNAWAQDPANQTWSHYGQTSWTQVHGHRNAQEIAIDAYPRSYNLEGKPDAGGAIRIVVLDEKGWIPANLYNRIFMHPTERAAIDKSEGRQHYSPPLPMPAWLDQPA